MKPLEDIKAFVVDLLQEGDALSKTQFSDRHGTDYVDHQAYHKFLAGFRLLLARLGPLASAWNSVLPDTNDNYLLFAMQVQGCLQAIYESLEKGRLSTLQELVTAEILSDVLEQAEVLLRQGISVPPPLFFAPYSKSACASCANRTAASRR